MGRKIWLSMLVLLAIASVGQAVITIFIHDPADDSELMDAVSGQKPVKEFADEIAALEKSLLANDEAGIEKLLGKPAPKLNKGFAIPVGHPRAFTISGLRYADEKLNKNHTSYYLIGDFACVEVHYGVNGTTPQFAVLYFKIDNSFHKLREIQEKASDKPPAPKGAAVIRKTTIDEAHWQEMKGSMNKEEITKLFTAPAGDSAPGTGYLTRSWGWRRGNKGKVHETLEWRGENGRIVVEFDQNGNFLTSEFYRPGRDPVTNVAERLEWDREKFAKLKKFFDAQLTHK
jgi:hypothetical protein